MKNIYLGKNFLTARLPLKLVAILVISFLGLATFIITYKTGLDVFIFFHSDVFFSSRVEKISSLIVALLITSATLVQSSPVIWEKLSYWGQAIDNWIALHLMRKIYFLNASFALLNKARNKIDEANSILQDYLWKKINGESLNQSDTETIIKKLLETNILTAINVCKQVDQLLNEGKPKDRTNAERKGEARTLLNNLIAQATGLLSKIPLLNE